MKRPTASFPAVSLAAVLAIFISGPSASAQPGPRYRLQSEAQIGISVPPGDWRYADAASEGPTRFVVLLEDPPLAGFRGGIGDLQPTSPRALGRAKLDPASPASRAYLSYLDDAHAGALAAIAAALGRQPEVVHRYRHALNGFALVLEADEIEDVGNLPGVSSVQPDLVRQTQTDNTPDFLGLTDTGGAWDNGFRGENIIIGVIDSGIWPEHPSFTDPSPGDGFDHVNPLGAGNFLGVCDPANPDFDPAFPCNDKLIGGRDFTGFGVRGSYPHGTASAGVAAGNPLSGVTIPGPTIIGSVPDTVSGIAPRAHVIAYRGCQFPDLCLSSDLAAAIDQAVADGVDVINYSLGGGNSTNPWSDADSLAYLFAADAGVFVATSAGNAGPGPGTLTGPAAAPWLTTVGATTHNRTFPHQVTLGNGATFFGEGLTAPLADTPLIDAENAGDTYCRFGLLDPSDVAGKIVLCKRGAIARVSKSQAVQAAGGGGMILYNANVQDDDVITDGFFIPSVHVDNTAGLAIKDYIASAPDPSAALGGFGPRTVGPGGDLMAGFSSRGPSASLDLIKPDVTAPGVNVLASSPSGTQEATFPDLFEGIQGTSMSSPHVAGLFALIKQAHPAWSPAMAKSAIMTTAYTGVMDSDGITPADPFDMGAGRIDPSAAINAGIVLDETTANFSSANPAIGGDPGSLNLPSMADGSSFGGHSAFTRTFTSALDSPSQWTASFNGHPNLVVTLDPELFSLDPGASQAIDVTVDASQALSNTWTSGNLTLTPSNTDVPTAHMPIAVRPISSTNAQQLTKTVDKDIAFPGNRLTYDIQLTNFGSNLDFQIDDPLPPETTFVPSSLSASTGVPSFDGTSVGWNGTLAPAGIDVAPTGATPGYVPLAPIVPPIVCSDFCNDGGAFFSADFFYNGTHFDQLTLSWDGTLEPGSVSGFASGPANENLPMDTIVDNLIAPFWTDLDPSQGGAVFGANLFDFATGSSFLTFEFNNVPEHDNPSRTHTFQIWIENGTDNISWVYVDQASPLPTNLTVGAENHDGTIGTSYFYNGTGTPPQVGTDLEVFNTPGGQVDLSFQADVGSVTDPIINIATATGGAVPIHAGVATQTCPQFLQVGDRTIEGIRRYCAFDTLTIGTAFTSTDTSEVTGIAPTVAVDEASFGGQVVFKNQP